MGEALVGCPFPDFSMEIVGNHPSQGNGEHMRLTDLTSNGRPTLLQFYACKRDRTLLHDARATVTPLATRCVIPHAPEVQGRPPPRPACTRQATPPPVRVTSKRHSNFAFQSPAARYSFVPSSLTTPLSSTPVLKQPGDPEVSLPPSTSRRCGRIRTSPSVATSRWCR